MREKVSILAVLLLIIPLSLAEVHYCTNCADCQLKINNAKPGDTIVVTNKLSAKIDEYCIKLELKDGDDLTLDLNGQIVTGHVWYGPESDGISIRMYPGSRLTIKNGIFKELETGIYVYFPNGNNTKETELIIENCTFQEYKRGVYSELSNLSDEQKNKTKIILRRNALCKYLGHITSFSINFSEPYENPENGWNICDPDMVIGFYDKDSTKGCTLPCTGTMEVAFKDLGINNWKALSERSPTNPSYLSYNFTVKFEIPENAIIPPRPKLILHYIGRNVEEATVKLNGHKIGHFTTGACISSEKEKIITFNISTELLKHGENTIEINPTLTSGCDKSGYIEIINDSYILAGYEKANGAWLLEEDLVRPPEEKPAKEKKLTNGTNVSTNKSKKNTTSPARSKEESKGVPWYIIALIIAILVVLAIIAILVVKIMKRLKSEEEVQDSLGAQKTSRGTSNPPMESSQKPSQEADPRSNLATPDQSKPAGGDNTSPKD